MHILSSITKALHILSTQISDLQLAIPTLSIVQKPKATLHRLYKKYPLQSQNNKLFEFMQNCFTQGIMLQAPNTDLSKYILKVNPQYFTPKQTEVLTSMFNKTSFNLKRTSRHTWNRKKYCYNTYSRTWPSHHGF